MKKQFRSDNINDYHFFWKQSPLSQWHKTLFISDENIFNSVEQYMMYEKAMLFDDEEIAEKILLTKKCSEQLALGRQIKDFDQSVWDMSKRTIVYSGNYLKFTQDQKCFDYLMSLKGKIIMEACPEERIWSIGYAEDSDEVQNLKFKSWGEGLLGEAIMHLRDNLE